MNYCTFCGTKLDPSQRYCTNCGAEVTGEVAVNPQIDQIEEKQSVESNHPAEKLKIDSVGLTILGLVTFGIWWTIFIKKWSVKHLNYYEDNFMNADEQRSSEIFSSVRKSTDRSLQLSTIILVMLSAGLGILIISFIWEVVLDIGGFPLPEEPFWLYCWISLGMLAVTWASVLLGIVNVLKLQSSIWYPLNASPEISAVTAIWCVAALGLLPLAIFPPIYSGSVNKYVYLLQK